MRIRRTIPPAVLAVGTTGAFAAGPVLAVAAAAPAVVAASTAKPNATVCHG